MNRLRSVLHALWMGITVAPWATVAVLISPFIPRVALYRFCVAWIRLIVDSSGPLVGIRNRVSGLENLPTAPDARVILLVKHQSAWETFAMATVIPRRLAYVFKRELLYIPFFGWAMGLLHMIHIDRSKKAKAFDAILEQGQRALDNGSWVILFPEGTRIARGERGLYHSGGARLAKACNAVIVPVAVTSAKCWPKHQFVKHPGIVDIAIGPVIIPGDRSARAITQEAADWIEDTMHRLDPEAYPTAPSDAPTPVSS